MLQALQQVEVYSSSTNSCRFSLPSLPGRVCQKKFLRSLCHPCQIWVFQKKKYLRSGCSPSHTCQASTPTTPLTMLTAEFSFVEDPHLVGRCGVFQNQELTSTLISERVPDPPARPHVGSPLQHDARSSPSDKCGVEVEIN